MKLLNFSERELILQNVREPHIEPPKRISKRQYEILCSIVRRKHITKQFFDFVVNGLYGVDDWKKLNYVEMYELIHVLANYRYRDQKSDTDWEL